MDNELHLSPQERAVLARLRSLARLMDEAISIPGTRLRFGLDSIVGLIPGVGDAATALLSAYIISEAGRMGVPRDVLLKMAGNLGIDLVVGSIPIAGDLFDVAWKANRKNIRLLEKYLRERKGSAQFGSGPTIDV